ncbi:MOSC domain-containing protein [Chitinasiproducens palmae]|uniref:MOSC domain-containing protein n=1 Tax=Chitinasiproducens palmae TaxID=1770053 RepID=A0A1H2PU74_9BURK|nr:MOSC N-terminal beta barrel domain-containing protein [Chitinasiproducens palmae]SDV50718.1 hypothetical protein SAMN05216551_11339 [Chitinasiproducens palmae]
MPRIRSLHLYPIKSCAAMTVAHWPLLEHGLAWDREWMLVDDAGRFVSQRTLPAMARIQATLEGDCHAAGGGDGMLHVSIPGREPLRLALQPAPTRPVPEVSVWRDAMPARDEGDGAAAWFSDALGAPVRLVRFAPEARRWASREWVGTVDVPFRFADGFPLLVTNEASLHDLNARLQSKGAPAIPMDRFRANVVLSDWDAYEEDYAATLDVVQRDVTLRLVKPCARCPIPGIDQLTGLRDPHWPHEPNDTLSTYRADPRVGGGVTFGQNAVVRAGAPACLAVGDEVDAALDFGD